MEISRRPVSGVLIFDLVGRLTAADGAKQLGDEFRAVVAGGHRNVLVNFRAVDFIDSTGLGALIVGSELVRSSGGQVRIMNSGSAVRQVLQITRLNRVLPNYEDEQSALASFAL